MFKLLLAIAVIVALLAIGPLLVIWSLNILFPTLAIAYTFETWAAVVLLGGALRANVTVKRRD